MALTKVIAKSDWVGIIASGLCLLHCLATPFLFAVYANVGSHEETHPFWWGLLDIAFLLLSFFAVYWSIRTTSKAWIKYAFGFSWFLLLLIVVNEKLELWHLPEEVIYPLTIVLIALHFYNHRYCHCDHKGCCVSNQ
ncbi:MerC family mercury resistance protein [Leptobacterium flavescens]|uniref:MerC family mercury resistance protein n=1 Tax=Leptobacterium flavescens TaxID=472055 RepID=A0A6P0USU1_9FLAO|nr:MerC domain-containing protein [Leptobacterium flavescens]NER14889.1 MerC family mercury resistance protein [Leptobacterium flavescens]